MSIEKTLLGTVPALQSTALLGYNLRGLGMLGKPRRVHKFAPKPVRAFPRRDSRNLIRMGVTNLVGVGLIGATAKAVQDLP